MLPYDIHNLIFAYTIVPPKHIKAKFLNGGYQCIGPFLEKNQTIETASITLRHIRTIKSLFDKSEWVNQVKKMIPTICINPHHGIIGLVRKYPDLINPNILIQNPINDSETKRWIQNYCMKFALANPGSINKILENCTNPEFILSLWNNKKIMGDFEKYLSDTYYGDTLGTTRYKVIKNIPKPEFIERIIKITPPNEFSQKYFSRCVSSCFELSDWLYAHPEYIDPQYVLAWPDIEMFLMIFDIYELRKYKPPNEYYSVLYQAIKQKAKPPDYYKNPSQLNPLFNMRAGRYFENLWGWTNEYQLRDFLETTNIDDMIWLNKAHKSIPESKFTDKFPGRFHVFTKHVLGNLGC